MASRTLHRRAGLSTRARLDEFASLICRGDREAFLCDADAMAISNTNRNHACVELATTSEAGAVDRHAVVMSLVLSVADIITSRGAPEDDRSPLQSPTSSCATTLAASVVEQACGLLPPSCPSTPP